MPTLQGDESAYVGVWASPAPPHMPASFLAVAFISSLLEVRPKSHGGLRWWENNAVSWPFGP